MTRQRWVIGNWKLHKTRNEASHFVESLKSVMSWSGLDVSVAIAPPFTALDAVRRAIEGTPIWLAAQHVHWDDEGAFTGEVSAPQLKDVGCDLCLVGHSERRTLFGDDNAAVARRIDSLLRHRITPVVCVGEPLSVRNEGRTIDYVHAQLSESIGHVEQPMPTLIVAYEPIWAIGTGKTANAQDAQTIHHAIRQHLKAQFGQHAAERTSVLYGGSVKPGNARALLEQQDVDGLLVGGASLIANAFAAVLNSALT